MPAKVLNEIYYAGVASYADGDYSCAKNRFGECLRNHFRQGEIFEWLGHIYQSEGDFESSIKCFRQSIEEGKTKADIYNGLAESLFEARRYSESEIVLEQALTNYPANVDLCCTLLRLYIETSQYQAATGLLGDCTLRQLANSELYYLVATAFYAKQEYDECHKAISKAIELEPDNSPQSYLLLARVYMKTGRLDQAEQCIRQSARIYPIAELFYPAAKLYQTLQRYETSLKLFDKALEVKANRHRVPEILYRQAEILFDLGENMDRFEEDHDYYEQAEVKVLKCLEVNSSFIAIWHFLALLKIKQKKSKEAARIFEQLQQNSEFSSRECGVDDPNIELLQSDFLIHIHYGYSLCLLRRYDEAVKELYKAIDDDKVRSAPVFECRVLRRLGITLLESGDYAKAEVVMKQLNQKDDDGYYQSGAFLKYMREIDQREDGTH